MNIKLLRIGAIGGILTSGMGLLYQNMVNNEVKQTAFYKQSMNLVRHHKAAVYFLGEPIKDCNIQFLNGTKSFVSDTKGLYEVKLKGRKQNGMLYINIEKDMDALESDWKLSHVELEIDDQPDKHLLIRPEHRNEDFSQQLSH